MEGLLILIGIWVLDVVVKKVAASRKKQQQTPPQYRPSDDESDGYEPQDKTQEQRPSRSLQDLIHQFEEAQQQAAQGNIEPSTPPVEQHRNPNESLSLRDIAEAVLEVDFIDLQFLMDEFDVDENTAAEMLAALQAHRIVGHDMGEGTCDVLVHDLEELDNLLHREKRAAEEQQEKVIQRNSENRSQYDSEAELARQRELERQRELNSLEERAKSARESAAAFANASSAKDSDSEISTPRRAPLVSTAHIGDVRKGFIWAKVLDEPRFKRRWSRQYR